MGCRDRISPPQGCQHALIGEELFAAAARLAGDRRQHAALVAQDRVKVALILRLLLGSALALAGVRLAP